MSDPLTEDQTALIIKAINKSNRASLITQLGAIIVIGLLVFKETGATPSIENTASPEFSNQVTTGSELDHIKDRANRRGYYYQSEFADLMGVSEKTIQRRIDDGRLYPTPGTDNEGRIRIELDTEILGNPGR